MTEHLALFQRIAHDLRVVSGDSFGQGRRGVLAPAARGGPPAPVPRAGAQPDGSDGPRGLWQFIYAHYYLGNRVEVRRLRRGEPEDLTPIVLREHAAFGQRLRAANAGSGYASPGWRVVRADADHLLVTRDGIQLQVLPTEVVSGRAGFDAGSPAHTIALRFPNHLPYANPGYYTAISDEGLADSARAPVVRVYFNVGAAAAADFLRSLTGGLRPLRVKYSCKILNHPRAYTRPDAAVLYVHQEDIGAILRVVEQICSRDAGAFRPRIPAFAKRLMPGIAIAEEPHRGVGRRMSFGQHRSVLVARGLTAAFVCSGNRPADRFRGIVQELELEGIDPSAPYLNARSADIYPAFPGSEVHGGRAAAR